MNNGLENHPEERPRLEIYTLGGLRILFDKEPLAGLTSRPAQGLLTYLACQPYPHSRLALAELLWPERSQSGALSNLRVTLHRMAALLGGYFVLQRETVSLVHGAAWLDVTEMECLLDDRDLVKAMELYQGDFLEGFFLGGSLVFEEWQVTERDRLRSGAMSALQQLIQQATSAGLIGTASTYCQRLLALDPLHEPALRQLMRLLAQDGQRNAALRKFAHYRRLLDNELGVEPEAATLELASQIQDGQVPGEAEPSHSPVESLNIPDHLSTSTLFDNAQPGLQTLPQPLLPLVGRQIEMKELIQMLANPDCRLLTVLGPGGIGKTRLAQELAHRLVDRFPDGVFFVSLAGTYHAHQFGTAIAAALEFTPAQGDNLEDALARFLKRKHLLLILDNFEQLLAANPAPVAANEAARLDSNLDETAVRDEADSANLLASLLKHTAQMKVLVTSRERLLIQGEWLYTLRGLSLASPAVEFFIHSAKRLHGEFSLAGDQVAVQEICRLLGGSPLAIELAAAWTPLLSPTQIAVNIRRDLDFLINRLADAPGRHRSVRALFEQAWQTLKPDEKRLFAWLAVFNSGARLEEILSVCQVAPALLLRLLDKSLIQEVSPGRLSLHELLHQYALEALHREETPGSEHDARLRHFEVYLALAEQAGAYLRRTGQETWLACLDAERENFQAALEWSLKALDPDQAARLAIALGWYWRIRSQVIEARYWLENLLAVPRLKPPIHAALLYHLGACSWLQGDFEAAQAQLVQSCALWEAAGESGGAGWAYSQHMLGMTEFQLQRPVSARQHFEASLTAFSRLGDPWGRAFSLGWLSKALSALGEASQADHLSKECLTIFRQVGDRFGLALFVGYEAFRAFETGDLETASKFADEAAQLRHTIGHQHSLGEALSLQAAIAERQGNNTEAIVFYRQAQAIYDNLGNQPYVENLARTIAILEGH